MSKNIKMKLLIIIAVLGGMAILFWLAATGIIYALHDFDPNALQIDACLDAGGAWDYEGSTCKY
ncbi:hypothetical protein [Spartinivicinus ruber]|uniref:hypothetical protein n=1 Tax=Spartinivicinus ruber TaxID=2683272 RepID=UPI0013D00DF8|nr:hypothetical protein [Spartinivicinus ruber]